MVKLPTAPVVEGETSVTVTFDELREAIRLVFYPAMPAWDVNGQERIDRATRRVLEAMGR